MKDIAKKHAAFLEVLRKTPCGQYVATTFLYESAPILRGVKPAALITLRRSHVSAWKQVKRPLYEATGLRTLEIINKRGTVLLFIYEEESLGEYLRETKSLALLKRYGYSPELDLGGLLEYLKKRFVYSVFPHEIGVFLGYPIKDVRSFIENKGRNSICCRYWKVYHDVEKAQDTFRRIDEAQNYALDILINPMPIHVAVRLLKTAS